jgi:hypothetical protein
MSTKCTFTDIEGVYFITSTVVDWIDIFTKKFTRIFPLTVLGFARKSNDYKFMREY